jgi:hypothetical protein
MPAISKHLIGSVVLLVTAMAFTIAALAQKAAQSDPAKGKDTPPGNNLSGVWVLHPSSGARAYSDFTFTKEEPSMTPWAEEKYIAAKPAFGPHKSSPQDSNDPVYGCLPPGLPRIYLHPMAVEILQLPSEVIMMFEYDRFARHIYTDGRKHDPDLDPPLWMGDSIGKWDGDTLVVDVIGFNEKTWLDRIGHPHSEALHVVERIRRVNHTALEDNISIEDPKALKGPWNFQLSFELKRDSGVDWEGVCEDKKLADRQ